VCPNSPEMDRNYEVQGILGACYQPSFGPRLRKSREGGKMCQRESFRTYDLNYERVPQRVPLITTELPREKNFKKNPKGCIGGGTIDTNSSIFSKEERWKFLFALKGNTTQKNTTQKGGENRCKNSGGVWY